MANKAKTTLFLNYHPPTTIFIVGPTASGKSSLALSLAEKIGAEIICADSQTLRRRLDIGTAKPTKSDQKKVPHHMIDCIEPYERYSVAAFQEAALGCIEEIVSKKKPVIVCGGSGLYCDSLFFNYKFSKSAAQTSALLAAMSIGELQEKIIALGRQLPKNSMNRRHLLGVLRRGNEHQLDRATPMKNAVMLGIDRESGQLRERIAGRIDQMFHDGLIEEVRALIDDYGQPPEKLDAIGYPLVARHLRGEITLASTKELFGRGHWHYARRQRSWFRRNPHIRWLKETELDVDTVQSIIAGL